MKRGSNDYKTNVLLLPSDRGEELSRVYKIFEEQTVSYRFTLKKLNTLEYYFVETQSQNTFFHLDLYEFYFPPNVLFNLIFVSIKALLLETFSWHDFEDSKEAKVYLKLLIVGIIERLSAPTGEAQLGVLQRMTLMFLRKLVKCKYTIETVYSQIKCGYYNLFLPMRVWTKVKEELEIYLEKFIPKPIPILMSSIPFTILLYNEIQSKVSVGWSITYLLHWWKISFYLALGHNQHLVGSLCYKKQSERSKKLCVYSILSSL